MFDAIDSYMLLVSELWVLHEEVEAFQYVANRVARSKSQMVFADYRPKEVRLRMDVMNVKVGGFFAPEGLTAGNFAGGNGLSP